MIVVPVVLSHRTASVNCSTKTYQRLREFWSFRPPDYVRSPKYQLWLEAKKQAIKDGDPDRDLPGWNGKLQRLSRNRLSAGLFRATYRACERELHIRFDIQRMLPPSLRKMRILELPASEDERYTYQDECVRKMQKAVKRGGGLILSATGTGKTAISGKLFRSLPDLACLFVVDTLQLLSQSQKEIAEWAGEAVGVVGHSEFTPQRITVATIQTLHKHCKKEIFQKWFRALRIVMIDELHEQMAKRNFKLMNDIRPVAVFGLTATLQLQRKHIYFPAYGLCGPVIFEFPYREGVEAGVLAEGEVLQLAFPHVPEEAIDWREEYEKQVMLHRLKRLTCWALVRYLVRKGRYVLVLVERVPHLKRVSRDLRETPHRVAYGKVSVKAREAAITELESGEIRLVIANRVFGKGTNIKRVDVGIEMSEWPDENKAQQKFGRLVRLHAEKKSLLHLDFTTQKAPHGQGRKYYLAGLRRRRALRANNIKVTTVKVASVREALAAVRKKL